MISVVMPVYNGQHFLARAMDSLLAQSFREFELIVVDDGSTDDSPAILARYARADARVRVIRGEHAGISAALNRGIADSRFGWIARMDADDEARPDRFERQIAAAAAHPNVVAWGSFAHHIDANGRVLGVSRTGPTSEAEFRRLRAAGEDVYVIHPTAMLRKDVLLAAGGYDGRFNYCEDLELFDRMAEHGPIVAIPEPLLRYRVHATSISMERFFTMRRLATFVRARQRARLAGLTLSREQFEQDEARRSSIRRAAARLHITSGYCYRRAGLAFAEGSRWRACAFLVASTLMNPSYAIPRVWDQVLSAKLGRRELTARDVEASRASALDRKPPVTPGPAVEPLPVLMPAYNTEAYIGQAIESVLAQTVSNLELLVIDDGSTDRTGEIVLRYVRKDPRVRLVSQANAGIAETLNRGLQMLRGEWVFLMHADDVMMPNRLERQAAFIAANPDLAVASSLVHYVNGAGQTIGRGRSPFTRREAVEAAASRGEMIAFNHPACALRREVVLEVGGYRQAFWPAEDCDLWSRIVERGHRVAVQDEYLLQYRIHGSSASISRARLMQQKTIWLEHCIAARRAGNTEPTWTEFQAQRRRASWRSRVNQGRQEFGRTFYQAAVHHLSTGKYHKLVPTLAVAAALEPGLVLSRVLPRLRPAGAHR